jgi:hypothetical protein
MMSAVSPHVILAVYWLLMVVIAAFFLRMACSICRMNLPTWRRSFISVLLVTFLAYLVFDFTGYLVMRSLQDIKIQVPPGYGYHLWFREPIGLKLAIISQGSFLRTMPFVFGLCAAGVLQVIVLQAQVTFRFGLLVFLMQWGATLVAGYIIALVMGVGLGAIGWTPQPPPVAKAPEQAQGPAKSKQPAARKGRQVAARPKKTKGKKTAEVPKAPEETADHKADSQHASLQVIQHEVEGAVTASREFLADAGKNLKEYADSHLEEVKEDLAPVTERLPEPVQRFLDQGGWYVLFGVLALIILLWLRSILRRLAGAITRPRRKRKRRTAKGATNLKENLKQLGDSYTEEGPQQITVKGLPARLRLVVLSLGARNAGELTPEMTDRVLDWIKPGLAEVTSGDYPRVRVWPPFYSADGFAIAFATNVRIPEPKGEQSRWVLVAGQVRMGRAIIQVGLALYADEESTLRNLRVRGERWLDVLGVTDALQPAGAR